MPAAREKADEILEAIAALTHQVEKIEKRAEAEIRALQEEYGARSKALKETLKAHEKALMSLMKKNRGELFGERDKVKLEHGILLFGKKDQVKIPRDALERLQELKWKDGINWTPSLNRPAIEGWTEERLAAIGAERKKKTSYSYELIQAKGKKPIGRAQGK